MLILKWRLISRIDFLPKDIDNDGMYVDTFIWGIYYLEENKHGKE